MSRFLFFLPTLLLILILAGCWGYSARDGDLTGQAKKLTHVTPLICPDYEALDVSLGIMKGGTGSMSTQDQWLTIASNVDTKVLQKAVIDFRNSTCAL